MNNREIDALVAEHVMGMERWDSSGMYSEIVPILPHYSSNISDAWQVVEKIEGQILIDRTLGGRWVCEILVNQRTSHMAEADTAEMAICLAALKAKGVDIDVLAREKEELENSLERFGKALKYCQDDKEVMQNRIDVYEDELRKLKAEWTMWRGRALKAEEDNDNVVTEEQADE